MAAPSRIGRFEVLGELASGGMGEILLARLVGPSGFERPVVIKRILPQWARDEDFVTMFLDEARIVSGIRHPNVVHVEELGHEGDDLYLVMEYLEGESVGTLLKRMMTKGRTLDLGIVAHVIAEACSGLHAAHELTDENGTLRNLVHRDISPQNLLVTYQGQLKILDFGIAQTTDRRSTTEMGQVKGKCEYMSPEQCRSLPLDRRSDVFALGIVLYEMLSGARLFHRFSKFDSMLAITNEPIVPPSRVRADVPAALDAICMRALARSPEERYPSAQLLRADLLKAARELPLADPEAALGTLMGGIFQDRITEKRELLRRVRAGDAIGAVPPGEIEIEIELPSVSVTLAHAKTFAIPAVPRKSRTGRIIALGALVVLVPTAAVVGRTLWLAKHAPPAVAALAPPPPATSELGSVTAEPAAPTARSPSSIASVEHPIASASHATTRTKPGVRHAPTIAGTASSKPGEPPPPAPTATASDDGFHRFR